MSAQPNPLDLFAARAVKSAKLWSMSGVSLHDVVDDLASEARRAGLDTDVAQSILSEAFRPYREAAPMTSNKGFEGDDVRERVHESRERENAEARKGKRDHGGNANGGAKKKWNWRDEVISARELHDQEYADAKFVVPDFFPEGVALIASRPKIGKSWWLMQGGGGISLGNTVFGQSDDGQPPLQGDVLYLALEDNRRRLRRRMTKHYGPDRENWPPRFKFTTKWQRLDKGGLDDIREWCASVAKPVLVMIDTLKKVRPPKRNNQNDYDADYEACEGLEAICDDFPGLGIWAAHHLRKMDAEDVFDTVSGTFGLTGGVDTIAIFSRSAQGVTLHIQGRDLTDTVEKAVKFDRETCRWIVLGNAEEVRRSQERNRIIAALRGVVGGLSVNEVKAAANLKSRDVADKLLQRMAADGEVVRLTRGKYGLGANVT
jgi:hypothetical protein